MIFPRSSALATLFALSLGVTSGLSGGCTTNIPNTTVEDTAENREIVAFLEEYRHALEERNVARLLEFASPRYLDDVGTIGTDDDLDFNTLREKLAKWRDRVHDVRYEIKYHRVTFDQSRIYVEFRYHASFLVTTVESEERWVRRLNDHRLILTREDEREEGDEPQEGRFFSLSGM